MPSEQRVERKLAAILAADIVGFSRLAGVDEDRTLARLRTLRSDLIDPTIAVHRGRVVKRTGDGLIIEFRSVVDAVRCAIECLNGMIERNAGLPPDRRIEFRVGIHLGDVVEEADGDLMGDGVNIAARLEGIAKPGAIYLSEDAYRQVKSRLDIAVSDVGATQLKNISELVHVYSVQVGKPSPAKPGRAIRPAMIAAVAVAGVMALAVAGSGAWYLVRGARPVGPAPAQVAVSQGPTVAVLPFVNESGDANNDALATRIAEDTVGYLGNFSWLRIVGRSAGSTKPGGDPIEAARQIGADYIVTGNLRSGAAALSVSFQVDDARSGARVWSKTLEPTAEAIRNGSGEAEIAGRASALIGELGNGAISDAEFKRIQSKPAGELSSYECIVLGNYSGIPAMTARGRACLEAVVEREPANANAWTTLALVLANQVAIGVGLPAEESNSVEKRQYLQDKRLLAALRAADLAPGDSAVRANLAFALYGKCQVDRARVEGEKAIALNPYDPGNFGFLGFFWAFSGHWDEGTAEADRAIAMLGPSASPFLWMPAAKRHWVRGEYQQAYEAFQHSYIEGFWLSHLDLAYTLPFLDRLDEAKAHVATLLKMYPTMTIHEADAFYKSYCFEPSFREKMAGALRKAGLPE
jgi:adenylate cyclase